MTTFPLLAAVVGAALVAGLCMAAAGIYGTSHAVAHPTMRLAGRLRALWRHQRARTWAIAGISGAVVWTVSGWPVGGIATALAVPGLPYFFAAGRIAEHHIDMLQGLEKWVRRLADSMAAGSAPVQTIVASAEHPPAAIEQSVKRLAAGLSSPRGDRKAALRRFADDIDDPLGDMVIVALGIAIESPSARVPAILRTLAGQLGSDVAARRSIETDRAEPRSEARTIIIVQIAFVAAVCLFTNYARAYDGLIGQLVLATLVAVVIGALVMLRRLSASNNPPRLLAHDDAADKHPGDRQREPHSRETQRRREPRTMGVSS